MPSAKETILAITTLAIAIGEGKSKRELIYLAEMFSQLSHTLKTMAFTMIEGEKDKGRP